MDVGEGVVEGLLHMSQQADVEILLKLDDLALFGHGEVNFLVWADQELEGGEDEVLLLFLLGYADQLVEGDDQGVNVVLLGEQEGAFDGDEGVPEVGWVGSEEVLIGSGQHDRVYVAAVVLTDVDVLHVPDEADLALVLLKIDVEVQLDVLVEVLGGLEERQIEEVLLADHVDVLGLESAVPCVAPSPLQHLL